MKSLANVFTSIFARGKLENSYVRNDQSTPITSQRNFDESQVCYQGECIPYQILEMGSLLILEG